MITHFFKRAGNNVLKLKLFIDCRLKYQNLTMWNEKKARFQYMFVRLCVCARGEFNNVKLNKLNCVFAVGGCCCSPQKPSIMINVHWMYKMWFPSIFRFGEAENKMFVFISNNNRSIKAYFDNIYFNVLIWNYTWLLKSSLQWFMLFFLRITAIYFGLNFRGTRNK